MREAKGVPKNSLLVGNYYSSLTHSTLKLFNAVPVRTQKRSKPTKRITQFTIKNGFIFSPSVFANYTPKELESVMDIIQENTFCTDKINSSFHKSWRKVRDASYFQLVQEQAFHYVTTYGYEDVGVFNHDTVFIPNERLSVPEITNDLQLSVIQGYTKKQIKEKLMLLLNSGIALKYIDDIEIISKYCGLSDDDALSINNKEVRIRLYTMLDLIPEDPMELFRLVLFNTTKEDLLIINKKMIKLIKESDNFDAELFRQYDENYGYSRLAEIFKRFKPLFLAFKANDEMKPIINKIGHLSDTYHKPMNNSILNDVTGMLKRNIEIKPETLNKELKKANIFRKIRLASALNYRMSEPESILYKIRNGKSHVKPFSFDNVNGAKTTYDMVLKSILGDLKHLKGKKVYIPDNIKYALPATSKQFTGNIPSGSYTIIPKDMLFGISWSNVDHHRVDLDLSLISLNHGKIGWDALYKTDKNEVLFSGDVVDAPNGASELFYVNNDYENEMILYLNYFNYDEDVPVPYYTVVADEHPNTFGKNYMIDPNNIKCVTKSNINEKSKILGLVKVTKGECRFYFSETNLGKAISSRDDDQTALTRKYLSKYTQNMITLNDVLKSVGVKFVKKAGKDVIDLSPNSLESDTIINLLLK